MKIFEFNWAKIDSNLAVPYWKWLGSVYLWSQGKDLKSAGVEANKGNYYIAKAKCLVGRLSLGFDFVTLRLFTGLDVGLLT